MATPEKQGKSTSIQGPTGIPYGNLAFDNVIKGKNYHEFKGKRYEVDTPYEELCWEEIINVRGTWHHRVWKYNNNTTNCLMCEKDWNLLFYIETTGVVVKCTYCNIGFPMPPCVTEDGLTFEDKAEKVLDEPIDLATAQTIANRTGQRLPMGAPVRQRPKRTAPQ